jgi:hypothetical protein
MHASTRSNKTQPEHYEEKATSNNVETVNYKTAQGKVKEINAASVALAATVAAQKRICSNYISSCLLAIWSQQ